jgi:hypothetical protein
VTFDNAINFDDYSKVDQAFFFQAAPLAASVSPVSPVPVEAGVAAGHSDSVDVFVPVFAQSAVGVGDSGDSTHRDAVWEELGSSPTTIVDELHEDLDWIIAPVGAASASGLYDSLANSAAAEQSDLWSDEF